VSFEGAARVAAVKQPRRNLELKAVNRAPQRSLEVCEGLGAEDQGELVQTDTYFGVPQGRLKLREERGTRAHLIAYERPNLPGQRESRYRLVEVDDPVGLREALSTVLGVSVVARKTRRLFVFQGIRIHLDQVEGLGEFIEFEAVMSGDDGPGHFEPLLTNLRRSFDIREEDLLRGSYSDLLLAATARSSPPR